MLASQIHTRFCSRTLSCRKSSFKLIDIRFKFLAFKHAEFFGQILDDSRKWWKARNHKGEVAHVPHTIVKKVNYLPSSPDIYSNPLYTQHRNAVSYRSKELVSNVAETELNLYV